MKGDILSLPNARLYRRLIDHLTISFIQKNVSFSYTRRRCSVLYVQIKCLVSIVPWMLFCAYEY